MTKDVDPAEVPAAKRNFALLALYQVLMRTGWIFKTESIIMPAVLDTLSGQAWMRGALPLLNRLGQSLPPLLVAGSIRRQPQKKWVCCASVALMSAMFVGLATIWVVPDMEKTAAAPLLFLLCYGLFFVFLGVNQLAQLTLQGKLLLATRRGRLLSVANGVGSVTSVACAVLLLPLWLREEKSGDFEHLFFFTAALFAAGGVVLLLLAEPADSPREEREHRTSALGLAWRTLDRNVAFRRAALVGLLYGTSTILFPHYQRMAQLEHLDLRRMIWWVAVQNIGTGLFSVPMGMLHERFGTRLVLRIGMLGICLIPPLALFLSQPGTWEPLYNLVFLLVGLSPVMIRALSDYTLEVSPQEDHPQYLGTMNLCISAPILLSVPAGWLMDRFGFQPVFLAVSVLLVAGWLCTFGLSEPRKRAELPARPHLPSLDSETIG